MDNLKLCESMQIKRIRESNMKTPRASCRIMKGLPRLLLKSSVFVVQKKSIPKPTLHQGLTLHPSCGFSTTRPTSAQLLMLLRMVAAELSWGRHDHAARNRGCLPGKHWLQWIIGFSFPILSRRGWVKQLTSKICTQYFRCMLTWPKSCGSQGRTVDLKKNSFHVNF